MVGPAQKVALSNLYTTATLNQPTMTRNIGGVAVDTLVTDFGTFGVMLNRWMPTGQIAVVDLSVCAPVWLEIPGKGLLFAEQLAKTGAKESWQLYGEVGLEYGPESYHGAIKDLS
ncbi:SU10 major capsid protein [Streptomyces microflavus]